MSTGSTNANSPLMKSNNDSIFPLETPYGGITQVDINNVDVYTRQTFKSLMEERERLEFPYFIAIVVSSKQTKIVDGTSFFRKYFDYKFLATSQDRTIPNARIYQINRCASRLFHNFGTPSELLDHKGHLAKFIYACDLTLDPKARGEERYYLGGELELESGGLEQNDLKKKSTLKRAFFWYNRSVEDGCFASHIALAYWYKKGNECVEASLENSLKHLVKAREAMPQVPENAKHMESIEQEINHIREQITKSV